MVVRFSALRTRPFYSQEILLVLIYVRGWVDPRAIVRSEGLCQWKIPMTPSGIEPATFRFVARPLNHCATAVPSVHLAGFILNRLYSDVLSTQHKKGPLSILGTRKVTCSTFQAEDPQLLVGTVQNLFPTAIWIPAFVHPLLWRYSAWRKAYRPSEAV